MVTLAQDAFNEHTDYIERDELGTIIGMWADYYQDKITPTAPPIISSPIHAVITHSGVKSEIRINGSYKKFYVTFYDQSEEIEFEDGQWSFSINGEDVSDLVETEVDNNQIKVKFTGGYEYMDNIMVVKYTSESGIKAELEVDIVGL